jgi:hypothetical protein
LTEPAKPRPAKPTSSITQVEGSGTGKIVVVKALVPPATGEDPAFETTKSPEFLKVQLGKVLETTLR